MENLDFSERPDYNRWRQAFQAELKKLGCPNGSISFGKANKAARSPAKATSPAKRAKKSPAAAKASSSTPAVKRKPPGRKPVVVDESSEEEEESFANGASSSDDMFEPTPPTKKKRAAAAQKPSSAAKKVTRRILLTFAFRPTSAWSRSERTHQFFRADPTSENNRHKSGVVCLLFSLFF